ncbi:hypothetical protein BBJ28_00011460 [Nothophytophthora sp. Chile5]|nr:hypothetical protein BBJ28_00011460 [Nothophytophthora sp. Chile5]
MDMIGEAPTPTVQVGVHEARVEEVLDRWLADPIRLDTLPDNTAESILKCWQRQEDTNNYHFLPRVVRILFAVSASSAAIERDFGVSGMMATSQLTNLSKYNIDMCSFLNRNRDFTDLCDCKPLTDDEYDNALPANMLVSLEPAAIALPFADEWEIQMMQNFLATSFDEESKGELGQIGTWMGRVDSFIRPSSKRTHPGNVKVEPPRHSKWLKMKMRRHSDDSDGSDEFDDHSEEKDESDGFERKDEYDGFENGGNDSAAAA